MKKKERLDVLLHDRGYFDSREKAKRAIMAGMVYIDNQLVDKAGTQVSLEAEIFVKENACKYVSRGGLKLEKSLDYFNLQIEGLKAIDIGASTGGFTDCMLKNGVTKVFAIDVGYGQLDWKLRNDERIVNMEKTNIRNVTEEDIADDIGLISIDVSFISLKLVLPVAYKLLADNGTVICLIKPQFEAGRSQIGKNGIVRDPKVHEEVNGMVSSFATDLGFTVKGLTHSPVKGAKGNIEYLLYLAKTEEENTSIDIKAIVAGATDELKKKVD